MSGIDKGGTIMLGKKAAPRVLSQNPLCENFEIPKVFLSPLFLNISKTQRRAFYVAPCSPHVLPQP